MATACWPRSRPRLRTLAARGRWALYETRAGWRVWYLPAVGRAVIRDRHGRVGLLCGDFHATPDGRIAGGQSLEFLGDPEEGFGWGNEAPGTEGPS